MLAAALVGTTFDRRRPARLRSDAYSDSVRSWPPNSTSAELTAYGEVLLRYGINVFDEMRQGLRSLEHLSDPKSGEVRLGCTAEAG
jgi:hypothetical protein